MTVIDTAAIARRFLAAYAAKDLGTIAGLLSGDPMLRDWNQEVSGREAFLAVTAHNFATQDTIAIDILRLHATDDSVAAEVLITVDGHIQLNVVDVFDVDGAGQVTAVRSFIGLAP